MKNLRNIQQIWKKRNLDKPLKSRKLCLLKLVLVVSCSSWHYLALRLSQVVCWHRLGLTRKWFSLELSVEGKQLRFSLKACLEKAILKMILLEQVHKKFVWVTINVFQFCPDQLLPLKLLQLLYMMFALQGEAAQTRTFTRHLLCYRKLSGGEIQGFI